MQVLCGGLCALDVLALQTEMQHYHHNMEGIPEDFNAIEDAQKLSKRAGKPITEDNLLLSATNVMLSTERFPQVDEIWEDLPKR